MGINVAHVTHVVETWVTITLYLVIQDTLLPSLNNELLRHCKPLANNKFFAPENCIKTYYQIKVAIYPLL